jgi:hypothetical protein
MLQQVTVDASGTSWVDNIPGPDVSTSYQAQNTSSEATRVGVDKIIVDVSRIDQFNQEIIVRISGPIDENGVIFSVTTEQTINTGIQNGLNYLYLETGVSDTERTIALTQDEPMFVPEKNGWYTVDNKRVLNTVVYLATTLFQVSPQIFTGVLTQDGPVTVIDKVVSDVWVSMASGGEEVRHGWNNPPSSVPPISDFRCLAVDQNDLDYYFFGDYDGGSPTQTIIIRVQLTTTAVEDIVTISGLSTMCGIWFDLDLYVAYENTSSIIRYDGFTNTALETITAAGSSLSGIAFAGDGNLISCDPDANLIHICDGFSNSILRSIETPQTIKPIDVTYAMNKIIYSSLRSQDDPAGYPTKYLYTVIDYESGEIEAQFQSNQGKYQALAYWGQQRILSLQSLKTFESEEFSLVVHKGVKL